MAARSKLVGAMLAAGLAASLAACTSGSEATPPPSGSTAGSPQGSIGDLPIGMTFEQAAPYFAYDATLPLDIREVAPARTQDGITIREISYDTATGRRGVAYLVLPPGDGPFAACMFLHAEGAGSMSKDEFLDEAVELAKRNVVSLLPSRYFPAMVIPSDWQSDRQKVVDQVVESRRGIDILLSQKGVDPARLGYVGHDYGAMSGALLAAVDKRIKTEVFLSFNPRWGDWFFINYNLADQEGYLKGMQGIDPLSGLARVAPSTVFLQYGAEDGFNPAEVVATVAKAMPKAKLTSYPNVAWSIDCPEARADRLAWLVDHLGLTA
jgi:hypothetical protein